MLIKFGLLHINGICEMINLKSIGLIGLVKMLRSIQISRF